MERTHSTEGLGWGLTPHGAYASVVERARREVAKMRRRAGDLPPDFLELARRWGGAIERSDAFTAGHCERVADLSCAIAAADGFAEPALYWIRVGALLHDVGKFVVPADVLNKPAALTAEEWAIVRAHPVAGVEMVIDVEFPAEVVQILRSHHERWDGAGYPDGLRRDAIPRAARIVAIADTYDALKSTRPYKRALTQEEALAIMQHEAGGQFDPELLARFRELVKARGT